MKLKKSLLNLMSDYYDMMSERVNEYKKSPPPENWDGVLLQLQNRNLVEEFQCLKKLEFSRSICSS